jgi:hypothetical protein
MLRVPTFVAPSRIAGVGLFAATNFPADTLVWEFTDGVDWRISADELAAFPEPYLSRLKHYLYQEDSGLFVLCGDNAKFMNHADVPNCDDPPDNSVTITRWAIQAGEELTCDYRLIDRAAKQAGMAFPEVQELEPLRRRA